MRGSVVGVLVATLGMTTPALTACNAISPDLLGDIGAGVTASGSPILVVAACDQTVTGLTFTSGDPPANEDWVSEEGRRGTFDVALEDSAGWDVPPGGGDVLPDEGEVLVAADFVGRTDDSGMGFIFTRRRASRCSVPATCTATPTSRATVLRGSSACRARSSRRKHAPCPVGSEFASRPPVPPVPAVRSGTVVRRDRPQHAAPRRSCCSGASYPEVRTQERRPSRAAVPMCPRGDLNPHSPIGPLAPQASASTNSATRTWSLGLRGAVRNCTSRPRASEPPPPRLRPTRARLRRGWRRCG